MFQFRLHLSVFIQTAKLQIKCIFALTYFASVFIIIIINDIQIQKYRHLNNFMMSLPLAKISKANTRINPTVSAISMNLSLGFLRVMISYRRNNMNPPSRAGMGSMFMMAKAMERKAVSDQKLAQSNLSGKILPIEMNPPTLS